MLFVSSTCVELINYKIEMSDLGICNTPHPLKDRIKQSDARLWAEINSNSEHPLPCLLSPKMNRIRNERGHPNIIPKIETERFKTTFLNRSLFNCK